MKRGPINGTHARTCPACGRRFVPAGPGYRYCSNSCARTRRAKADRQVQRDQRAHLLTKLARETPLSLDDAKRMLDRHDADRIARNVAHCKRLNVIVPAAVCAAIDADVAKHGTPPQGVLFAQHHH